MTTTIPPWVPDTGGESPDDWDDVYDDDGSQDYWQCAGCGVLIPDVDELCGDCIEDGCSSAPVVDLQPAERYL